MKKKILILGSSGQIGGHLVDFFRKYKKYRIINFDIQEGSSFDLRNLNNKKIKYYIKKSDFIFFLAFDVGGSRYLKKYQHSYNFLINNMLIMNNVFKLIKENNKKFIFASSQMSNMDFSPYGTLKRLGESLTKSLNGLYVKFWNYLLIYISCSSYALHLSIFHHICSLHNLWILIHYKILCFYMMQLMYL